MSTELELIDKLTTLNDIAQTLNQSVDVRGVLADALARLVDLMGLETGWIFLIDPDASERRWGSGFTLAAWHNLPPALALDKNDTWEDRCDCQNMCLNGKLTNAFNAVWCSRLARTAGAGHELAVHATAPIRSGDQKLGILNVAGPDWESFRPEALALLFNVGSQMGVALERANFYDLLREQRIHEQGILLELSNQLLKRPDLSDLMDYLVKEAHRLLQVDACSLLLPGERPGTMVFQAASGWLQDPLLAGYEPPGDPATGPGAVMHNQQPLLVADLTSGEPICWKPEWQETEEFRGHAAVPLIADGRSIGVLVADTRHPGVLGPDKVRLMQLMANQAAIAIETARLRQEEWLQRQTETELAVARQIQLGLLPRSCPDLPGWDCASLYQAARQVGGDFYDFFELPGEPRRIGLVIADVADKGVPAALYMALCRTTIRTTALGGRSPAAALKRANDLLLEDSHSNLFVTVVYGVLEVHSGRLVYANAGHNRPLLMRPGSMEPAELEAQGMLMGILPEVEIEERELVIAPGESLLFYTDGVTEAMDPAGQLFGEERLRQTLWLSPKVGAQEMVNKVVEAIGDFAGDTPQSDDLTLFVIKRDS